MADRTPVLGGTAAEAALRYALPGTGQAGRTPGGRLAELGHEVRLGSRTRETTAACSGPPPRGPAGAGGG
ncbi:hypothetical protein [Streptomyces variegatus]|uniref:hypothetical protein n=1 Tax=Streptomyces variegatus TaxID=284040 RepID=UPI003C2C2650